MNEVNLYVDGAARGNPGLAGAGVVLRDDQGNVLKELSSFLGENLTNNKAEYSALLLGLELAKQYAKNVKVYSDSQLMVRQMIGEYRVKNKNLIPLYLEARNLVQTFDSVEFHHIERSQNKLADKLANKGIDQRD